MNRNLRQHPAIAAANEFARNVMGDARILRRELKDDDTSRAVLEETANFLGQLAQDMASGAAPQQQPETPGRSLSDLASRPEPAAPEAAPEDEQSAVAQLLAKMNGA